MTVLKVQNNDVTQINAALVSIQRALNEIIMRIEKIEKAQQGA